ncbi:MAG TPA: cytochrome-c peroxidase [Polyangiaceae bacterium]|nr:cytochrome-c peroxidase [Polyangiaceae bacterium]
MKTIISSRRSGVHALSRPASCAAFLALAAGCNSFDKVSPESKGSHLVIPTDTRPAFRASRTPVPISGGTLLVTRHGSRAVASDPDRDAIVVADLDTDYLATLPLQKGDEPGRLVEDDAGRVHVALRRGGAVVTIDPVALTVIERQPVCGAPRGLAISSPTTLEVACADGKLVTLPLQGGAPLRTVSLEPDLRDVVSTASGLTVSRFKSAELLRVDTSGSLTRRDRLPEVTGSHTITDKSQPADPEFGSPLVEVESPFRPLIAWRTLAGPGGSTVIVHQRALDEAIDIVPPSMNGSSYGGASFSCSGIAQNAISVVGSEGAVASATFTGAPLPVDAALSPNGQQLLVAMAGPRDPQSPKPFVDFEGDGDSGPAGLSTGGFGGITTLALITLPSAPSGPAAPAGTVQSNPGCGGGNLSGTELPPAVAVAYDPSVPSRAVVQTVQPSTLVIIDLASGSQTSRSFDDGTTRDTGFELFHRDSGAGVACATCHAEGAEDGNVWRFTTVGERRTQALHVGLEGTAPFHWDGELGNVAALMNEVFVGRMGGIHESGSRLAGLQSWLFALDAPVPLRASNDEAVLRGAGLFRSSGCAVCHSGAKFTNNKNVSVGTNSPVPLQVPSLIGVGYRAPFLHNGCATTLADRFNPACGGGDDHGSTSKLTTAEIGDLVAYLESL